MTDLKEWLTDEDRHNKVLDAECDKPILGNLLYDGAEFTIEGEIASCGCGWISVESDNAFTSGVTAVSIDLAWLDELVEALQEIQSQVTRSLASTRRPD